MLQIDSISDFQRLHSRCIAFPGAYIWLVECTKPQIAWEFLKRNRNYQVAYLLDHYNRLITLLKKDGRYPQELKKLIGLNQLLEFRILSEDIRPLWTAQTDCPVHPPSSPFTHVDDFGKDHCFKDYNLLHALSCTDPEYATKRKFITWEDLKKLDAYYTDSDPIIIRIPRISNFTFQISIPDRKTFLTGKYCFSDCGNNTKAKKTNALFFKCLKENWSEKLDLFEQRKWRFPHFLFIIDAVKSNWKRKDIMKMLKDSPNYNVEGSGVMTEAEYYKEMKKRAFGYLNGDWQKLLSGFGG